MIFRFGGVEVDERRFELRHDGKVVPVQRRVLETLLFLIHSGGRLVTKSDLLDGPWRGSVVTDAAFAQAIMLARRALGAGGRSGAVITTVRGKGFRLDVAQAPAVDRHHVQGVAPEKAQLGAPLPVKPRARSAVSGRTRERLELAKRLVELADHDADDALGLDARLLALQALMRIGDGARTDGAAAEYLSLAERKGAPRHLFFASIVESTRSFRAGDVALAASALKRALATSASVGSDADRIVAVHLVNLALEQRGRERRRSLELARGLATKVLRRTPELALGGSLFAVTALQLADRPQALRHFRELASRVGELPVDRYFTATLVGLSDLAIAFRDASLLRELYRRLLPFAGEWVSVDLADWGPVHFHLARAAQSLGDRRARDRHFERARVEAANARSSAWLGWIDHAEARALEQAGSGREQKRAAALLSRSLARARSLGLGALEAAASGLGQAPSPVALLSVRTKKRARR